jgi:preprotein translocase subunit SecE
MPSGAFFRIRGTLTKAKLTSLTFMNKLIQYLKETKAELKEVVFPTTSQTIIYTILVIVISVIVAVSLGGIDVGLRALLERIINR